MTPLAFWYEVGQGQEHLATTPGEIDSALDRVNGLSADHGTVATVVRRGDEAATLYVGLRGHVGALYYTSANEGHWSRGTAPATGPLPYDWQQNVFLFPPDAEIPAVDVRAAVHEFAQAGTRPSGVRWQEWEPPHEPGAPLPDPHDADVWG